MYTDDSPSSHSQRVKGMTTLNCTFTEFSLGTFNTGNKTFGLDKIIVSILARVDNVGRVSNCTMLAPETAHTVLKSQTVYSLCILQSL